MPPLDRADSAQVLCEDVIQKYVVERESSRSPQPGGSNGKKRPASVGHAHTPAGLCSRPSTTDLLSKQSEREARITTFDRKRACLLEEAEDTRQSLLAKHEALDCRHAEWQRELWDKYQAKAFSAQQTRNEQQKLRKEIKKDEMKFREGLKRKLLNHDGEQPDDDAESHGPPDVVTQLREAHAGRMLALDHAQQFVRINERRAEAYWRKIMPGGWKSPEGQPAPRSAEKDKKSSRLGSRSAAELHSMSTKHKPTHTMSFSASSGDMCRTRKATIDLMPCSRYGPDNDKWPNSIGPKHFMTVRDRFADTYTRQNDDQWRKLGNLFDGLQHRQERRHFKLGERAKDTANKNKSDMERSLNVQRTNALTFQAELEESKQLQAAKRAALDERLAQKKKQQEEDRLERAAMGKETAMLADEIQTAKEMRMAERVAERDKMMAERFEKRHLDFKSRAGENSEAHAARTSVARDRRSHWDQTFRDTTSKHLNKRSQHHDAFVENRKLASHERRRMEHKEKILDMDPDYTLYPYTGSSALIAEAADRPPASGGGAGSTKAQREALAASFREALTCHLRIAGMTLTDVYKIMDNNGNGDVSMSEFTCGLAAVSFDTEARKVGTPRSCFLALSKGKTDMFVEQFVGPTKSDVTKEPAGAKDLLGGFEDFSQTDDDGRGFKSPAPLRERNADSDSDDDLAWEDDSKDDDIVEEGLTNEEIVAAVEYSLLHPKKTLLQKDPFFDSIR